MNKQSLSSRLAMEFQAKFSFWGEDMYLIDQDIHVVREICDDYRSRFLWRVDKNDIALLHKHPDILVCLFNLKERVGIAFFFEKNQELFRFDPVIRSCHSCNHTFFLGRDSCLEVDLGIHDKSGFFQHQKKLDRLKCPKCNSDFHDRVIILFDDALKNKRIKK